MVLMTFLTYLATDLDATVDRRSYARRCDVLDDVCHVRDAIVAAMSEMQDAECAVRDERPAHGGLHTNSQLSAESFDIDCPIRGLASVRDTVHARTAESTQ